MKYIYLWGVKNLLNPYYFVFTCFHVETLPNIKLNMEMAQKYMLHSLFHASFRSKLVASLVLFMEE